MVIVDSKNKLEHLNKLIDENDCLVEIIPTDYYKHPCTNSISLIVIKVNKDIWVVGYDHPDLDFVGEVEFCFLNKKYVVDSKNFYHYFDEPNVMDVNLIAYLCFYLSLVYEKTIFFYLRMGIEIPYELVTP